jgi:hypothetical protein
MKKLLTLTLSITPTQMSSVCNELLNASLVREVGGNYRITLMKAKNRSLGRVKKLYEGVLALRDDEFDVISKAISEV